MRIAAPIDLDEATRGELERLSRKRHGGPRGRTQPYCAFGRSGNAEQADRQATRRQHTHGGLVAGAVSRFRRGGIAQRRRAARTYAQDHSRSRQCGRCQNHAKHTGQRHPLVHARHGPRGGISEASVRRIWHAHGLKPHRVESFKISNDPDFAAKLEDVVGLYLHPPEHALVLSVDEKSQIQALDRTQPGLPMKKGRGATMTHDYKRNGTTTLFAALNTANGEVYGLCQQKHRHQEWLKFLRLIDRTVEADKQIHIICDNYGTHKHERVQRWLARHKRFHMHFTPTSASWLNMIERFFRDLTENRIRRGVFQDLEQLILAIGDYIDRHNESPKPFIWTAKANDILEKVTRAQAARNKRLSV
jgi:transposase